MLGFPGPSRADAPPGDGRSGQGPSSARFAGTVLPFLSRHCYSCHGGGKNKGELTLDKYKEEKALLRIAIWERSWRWSGPARCRPRARTGRRPDPAEAEPATRAIDEILDQFDCTGPRQDGRVTIRRLNRAEYNNTIRDLVGVNFKPSADFPNDDVGYGFDNIGDVLSLSPLLLEKYLAAAETILDRAIVIADPPKPKKERLGSLRAPSAPAARDGGAACSSTSKGQVSGQIYVDEGDYTIRAEVFGQQLGDEPVRGGPPGRRRRRSRNSSVTATEPEPATIEANGPAQGRDSRTFAVAFLNPYTEPAEARRGAPEGRPRPAQERRPAPPALDPTSTGARWSSGTSRSTAPTTRRRPNCPRPTGGSSPTGPTSRRARPPARSSPGSPTGPSAGPAAPRRSNAS